MTAREAIQEAERRGAAAARKFIEENAEQIEGEIGGLVVSVVQDPTKWKRLVKAVLHWGLLAIGAAGSGAATVFSSNAGDHASKAETRSALNAAALENHGKALADVQQSADQAVAVGAAARLAAHEAATKAQDIAGTVADVKQTATQTAAKVDEAKQAADAAKAEAIKAAAEAAKPRPLLPLKTQPKE